MFLIIDIVSTNDNQDESLSIFVGLSGMDVNIESDIMIQKREVELQECYKDRLLANLYFTVELLKQEPVEKIKIIYLILSKKLD